MFWCELSSITWQKNETKIFFGKTFEKMLKNLLKLRVVNKCVMDNIYLIVPFYLWMNSKNSSTKNDNDVLKDDKL